MKYMDTTYSKIMCCSCDERWLGEHQLHHVSHYYRQQSDDRT